MYVTEVIAEDIMLLGGRDDHASGERSHRTDARRSAQGNGSGGGPAKAAEDDQFEKIGITDDDVPW